MPVRTAVICLAVVLVALTLPCAVRAGDACATFQYRLTCPYSSFVEARVSMVSGDQVCAKVTRNLLREPGTDTMRFGQSSDVPMEHRLKQGDLVLINYWTKPRKINYTLFPNSISWGAHCLGRITAEGKSVDAPRLWIGFSELVNWYYRTAKWDAKVVFKTAGHPGDFWYRAYAVEKNGTRHLIYDEHELIRRRSAVPASRRK
jgi:hypothetical protein